MKALTVQQPWAWAIFNGKNIENRTQLWRYRGPLAIHAGERESQRGWASPLVDQAIRALPRVPDRYGQMRRGIHHGAILGVVDLVDVHPDAGCCTPWGESSYVEHGGRERRRIVHLVLENPVSFLDPIPCKGALGLWTPPADVLDQIRITTLIERSSLGTPEARAIRASVPRERAERIAGLTGRPEQ